MLVRATTKNYNQLFAELIAHLWSQDRSQAGDAAIAILANQKSSSRYWPDDNEIREELRSLPAYRRLGRGRLRMVLEAIEDHRRGWHDGQPGLGGERVARGRYAIEHVMPRKWELHWPLPDGSRGDGERNALIHTIGNLTLLMSKLNAKVSNGPWLGETGKRHGLEAHDVLLLNRDLLRKAGDAWTDAAIRSRSDELSASIIQIWPAPEGHSSGFGHEKAKARHRIDLSDLLSAGVLQAGMPLFPRQNKYSESLAALLPDGRIDISGTVYSSPSEAAKAVTGATALNGWWFFLVDKAMRRCLRDVRLDYLESIAGGDEEEDAEDDLDDDA